MDAAECAPRADKRHVAVGDKIADGLRDRFVGVGREVPFVLGELLGHAGVLPGKRSVDIKEADICRLLKGVAGHGMGRFGGKARLKPHDPIEVLFDAGNRDADNDLGDFAGDDKTLGACFDKGRIVRHDRGVHDFDPQTRGTVGRAHNVADSAQKLDDPLGKEMVVVFRVVV